MYVKLILLVVIITVTIFIINCLFKSNFKNTEYNKLVNYKIIKINNYNSDIIFVNYYTSNNGYKKFADNLINSLNKFNLNYYIVDINTSNYSWAKLCTLKPLILINVMKQYPNKHVCWIDADAEIIKYPYYLNNIFKSIAINCRSNTNLCINPWACFIYFKNNNISLKFLNDWFNILNKNKNKEIADQIAFKNIINKKEYLNNLQFLPREFIVKSYNKKHIKNAVIIEHEASNSNKDNNINKLSSNVKGT